MQLRISALALALTTSWASVAAADPPVRPRDVQLYIHDAPFVDGAAILGTGTVLFLSSVVIPSRLADVAPLDGLGHRDRSKGVDRASDVLLGFGILGGTAGAFGSELAHGTTGIERARAPLVLDEGALFASTVTSVIKELTGVCRPRDWRDSVQRCDVGGEVSTEPDFRTYEAHRSFPSGHVTPVAGMMGAAYGLWLLPTGRRDEFAPLALSMTAIAGSLVILREQAGAHSWVDTGTAFVLGGAIGFATAALHLQSNAAASTPLEMPAPKTQMSFGGAFLERLSDAEMRAMTNNELAADLADSPRSLARSPHRASQTSLSEVQGRALANARSRFRRADGGRARASGLRFFDMLLARLANLDAARARFGDRVDRLLPFLEIADPPADSAVAELAAHEGAWPIVNRALANGWQLVPESMPAMRELLAWSERVPAWVDWPSLERGGEVLLRAGPLGGTVLGAESLVYGYCSPGGNKPLVMSGRLRDQAARRLNETARFVHATVVPNGLRPPQNGVPSGEGYRITVKVRLMHAQVRRLLRASPKWRSELWAEPINQHDMAATSLLFSAIVLDGLRKLGYSVTEDESHAYMQLWRYSAHLIGVDPELQVGSEREALRLGELIAATEAPPDDDSRELVRALMDAGERAARTDEERERARRYAKFAEGVCRGLIGDELADQLALPRNGWRFSVPAVRTVVRGMEAVRRRVPLGDRVAAQIGARYWAQVVAKGLAEPPDFKVPERLSGV